MWLVAIVLDNAGLEKLFYKSYTILSMRGFNIFGLNKHFNHR